MNIDLDKELEQLIKYSKDVEYFTKNYDKYYEDVKNEFVAVKDEKVYHNKDLNILLKSLKDSNIKPVDTFIEFIKDQEIIYV